MFSFWVIWSYFTWIPLTTAVNVCECRVVEASGEMEDIHQTLTVRKQTHTHTLSLSLSLSLKHTHTLTLTHTVIGVCSGRRGSEGGHWLSSREAALRSRFDIHQESWTVNHTIIPLWKMYEWQPVNSNYSSDTHRPEWTVNYIPDVQHTQM